MVQSRIESAGCTIRVDRMEKLNITADGIAGKCGEWVVVSRTPTASRYRVKKVFIVYSNNADYKVQIFNHNSELWKTFDTLDSTTNKRKAFDFVKTATKMIFYKGKLYKSRKELYKRALNKKFIKKYIDNKTKQKIINFALKNSVKLAMKKYNVSRKAITDWLNIADYVYMLGSNNNRGNGKWVKK